MMRLSYVPPLLLLTIVDDAMAPLSVYDSSLSLRDRCLLELRGGGMRRRNGEREERLFKY